MIYITDDIVTKKCPNCGQDFGRLPGQVHYMIGKNEFCTWTCKCAYRRKLEQEENERILKAFNAPMSLGDIVIKYRKKYDLPKSKIYIECGIGRQTYNKIESNMFTTVPKKSIIKVCKYLNIPKNVYENYIKED